MNSKVHIKESLVSVDWLDKNIQASNLVIIDATLHKITQNTDDFEQRDIGIKNARFLDIKHAFSDTSTTLPNMMLSAEKFQEQARLLGIHKDTAIVVYDAVGTYSSPRVWWMFRAMGHTNVAVLNGGLPEWIHRGFETHTLKSTTFTQGNFNATYNSDYFTNFKDVLKATSNNNIIIGDARSRDRFKGLIDEPREGLRAGHIPNSENIPYTDLQEDGKMLVKENLTTIFNDTYVQREKKVIFSCGSGITACILALGAEIADVKNMSVYDGSWTEWGSNHELPIEK